MFSGIEEIQLNNQIMKKSIPHDTLPNFSVMNMDCILT